MKFFVIHYTPLIERKEMIIKEFNKENINNYEIIVKHDREKIDFELLNKYNNLKLSEISLFLKHVEVFKKEYDDIIIVLEDDSLLPNNFINKINELISEAPENWDIIFCSESCNLHNQKIDNKLLYENIYARGTGMYILNKSVAKKLKYIYDNEETINYPIDHWFSYIYKKYELKYFWSEPTLIIQGSEIGMFASSIR